MYPYEAMRNAKSASEMLKILVPNTMPENPKPTQGQGRGSAQVNKMDGCKIAGIPTVEDITTYDLFFHVKHVRTGNSMANVRYKITLTDGSTFEGITDENGYTEKAFSNTAQMAKIEVPYHDSTINSNKQLEPCCC